MGTDLIAQFINWEQVSCDAIDFKKIYVDIAGDLIAGLVLSQIIYWHLPGPNGITKLSVSHDGELWIAKKREDWWDEVRVGPRQMDRAIDILKEKELVVTGLFKFNNTPILHVRINWDSFISQFQNATLPNREVARLNESGSSTSRVREILLTENTSIDYNSSADAEVTPDGELSNEDISSLLAKPSYRPNPKEFKRFVHTVIREGVNLTPTPLSKTELESLLEATMRRTQSFRHLSKAMRLLLRLEVVANGATHDSPETLWDSNPRFKEFCVQHCEWFSIRSKGVRSQERLVRGLVQYDRPTYGWLAFSGVRPVKDNGPQIQPYTEEEMYFLFSEDKSKWPEIPWIPDPTN